MSTHDEGTSRANATPSEPIPAASDQAEQAGGQSRRAFLRVLAAGSLGATAAFARPLAGLAPAESSTPAAPGPLEGDALRRRDDYTLFQPGQIGRLALKNRFCRSAAFEGCGDGKGFVLQQMLDFHRGYAEGGVALTLTGYQAVMEYGRPGSQIGAWDDRFIPDLSRIARAVHEVDNGCKVGAQIGHDGISRDGSLRGETWHAIDTNPTGGRWPGRISPSGLQGADDHALTIPEIERFCADMGRAAYRLQQAGFDCIQIHGAHGYLIDTFLSPRTNHRTDEYGGSLDNRVNIVRRVMHEVRDRAGLEFTVLFKVNCFDSESDDHDWPTLAKALEATGIDALDISGANMMRGNLRSWQDQSYFRPYAQAIDLQIPVILGCGNRDIEYLETIFKQDQGKVDFVNMARPLIREPDLVKRWQEGRGPARAACTDTSACFRELTQTGNPMECVVLREMMASQAFAAEYTAQYGA
jgi:2,4-dienoyl-CoA reductase-like NADH-dependent reductase (Old Yellow Enzyme family)